MWSAIVRRSAAYRAPGAPITSFAVESLLDDLARKLQMDPLTLREKNAAKNGTKTHYGPSHQNIGFEAVLASVKSHPHWKTPVQAGPWPRHGMRLLVQRRRRIDGTGPYQRRRFGDRGDRQPGHRRFPRVDRHDGRRGARHSGVNACAHGRRRHDFDRLHPCHRWIPRDLRHRHGGDPGGREGGRGTEEACSHDLGNSGRGGRMEGRQGVPGRLQRRCVRSAGTGGDRAEGSAHRGPDQCRGVAQCTGSGPGFGSACLRS